MMVAPGRAPPVVSRIEPETVAVVTCADAGCAATAAARHAAAMARRALLLLMNILLRCGTPSAVEIGRTRKVVQSIATDRASYTMRPPSVKQFSGAARAVRFADDPDDRIAVTALSPGGFQRVAPASSAAAREAADQPRTPPRPSNSVGP